jgi:hypothetical protein
MSAVKLSIHEDYWQFAFTQEAIRGLPPGMPRQLARFVPSADVAPGWQRAVIILVPTTALSRPRNSDADLDSDIQWWPSPPSYQHFQFHVLIGAPDADRNATVKDMVGTVGFIKLSTGHLVGVLATVVPLNAAELEMIEAERSSAFSTPLNDPVSIVSWGEAVDDGTPHLIDIGGTRSSHE